MPIRIAARALLATAYAGAALAQSPPTLFKIVSPKDDVTIGLADTTLDALAKRLAADGQISAWQYAVHKATNGDLEQAPLRRVAIIKQDTTRIETVTSPLKILPLPP